MQRKQFKSESVNSERVLVVEGDRPMQVALSSWLSAAGHQCETAISIGDETQLATSVVKSRVRLPLVARQLLAKCRDERRQVAVSDTKVEDRQAAASAQSESMRSFPRIDSLLLAGLTQRNRYQPVHSIFGVQQVLLTCILVLHLSVGWKGHASCVPRCSNLGTADGHVVATSTLTKTRNTEAGLVQHRPSESSSQQKRGSDMSIFLNEEASDEPVETAIAALSAGWASLEEISDAAAARRAQRPVIGQLLLKSRKLTVQQVFAVLAEEASSNKLFGQIAVEMGFVSAADLRDLLHQQTSMCQSLRQVLESRGVVTPAQAESIREIAQARLRQPAEAALVARNS